jgi:putative acetyltransferase
MILEIERGDLDSFDARRLLSRLDEYLGSLYSPEDNFIELEPAEVEPGRGTFLIARVDGRPVGCGAMRWLDQMKAAELKRLFVEPLSQHRGIGSALLDALESAARSLGASRVVGETGDLQPDVLRLLEHRGYSQIPCFGQYANSPRSICMERMI